MHPVTVGHEASATAIGGSESPFPTFERVIYHQNPLIEVACQLKFSPILRIDTDLPAEFQDRIRSKFPVLKDRAPEDLPPGIPPQIGNLIRNSFGTKQRPEAVYDFASADERWSIRLTHDSIALTATEYRRWEDFKTQFVPAVEALIDIYRPAFYTRVGLRYQDLIQRSKLHLADKPWAALLKPQIAGLFTIDGLQVVEAFSIASIRLPREDAFVRIRHGLAEAAGTREECYLIDSDFFTDRRIDVQHVFRTLDYFNSQAGSLFHWCIDDRLHVAMEPEPVG